MYFLTLTTQVHTAHLTCSKSLSQNTYKFFVFINDIFTKKTTKKKHLNKSCYFSGLDKKVICNSK